MTFRLLNPLMLTAFVGLTACGASGGGGGGSVGGGGGPTAPTPGTNGLDFGNAGQQLSDAEGTEVTMRTANFQAGSAPSISTASITVNADFFDGGTANLDGTIEIYGQTVTITNGAGALSSGEEVRLTYEPNRSGTYAAAIDASVSSLNDINGEGAYVLGFETNPNTITARTSGVTTYRGDFQASTAADGVNVGTEYQGGITVVVDFVDDDADFTLDGTLGASTPVDLGATGLDISGNGIAGDLTCTSGCENAGNSAVDATFYGPNADELGGVLSIDIEVDGNDFEGVGTFIITP